MSHSLSSAPCRLVRNFVWSDKVHLLDCSILRSPEFAGSAPHGRMLCGKSGEYLDVFSTLSDLTEDDFCQVCLRFDDYHQKNVTARAAAPGCNEIGKSSSSGGRDVVRK